MKRLVAVLTGTTLFFAATTFYFMYLLGLERDRNQAATATPAAQSRSVQAGPASRTDSIDPTATIESPARPDEGADSKPRLDAAQTAVIRDRLQRLRDPATRAEQAKQFAALIRDDWRTIAPRIGMPPDELERMLARWAELTQQGTEQQLECELDPSCDAEALETAPGMSMQDRVATALGPERYARYKAYQELEAENRTVHWLNERLGPANALNDATEQRLVQVLSEQRRQFNRDAEARGEKVDVDGGEVTIRAAAVAGASDEYARRSESATAYVRRSVELASGVLTREQLAAFREFADRNLQGYTERMRRAEIADAARKAARP